MSFFLLDIAFYRQIPPRLPFSAISKFRAKADIQDTAVYICKINYDVYLFQLRRAHLSQAFENKTEIT
jgi:hypothetical protein